MSRSTQQIQFRDHASGNTGWQVVTQQQQANQEMPYATEH
jgi:hypothetical protein